MQKVILIMVICFTCSKLFSQGAGYNSYGGYVRFEGARLPGQITVSCTGFGKTKKESGKDAINDLFFAFLFIGIPGSQYELPILKDETNRKHSVVVNLIDNISQLFILEDIVTNSENKSKNKDGVKGVVTIHRITINCEAIIRHLQKNGLLKKFGY